MTMYIIGLIIMKLLSVAIFFLVLFKIISLIHSKTGHSHSESENRGVSVLKERFASGEIDEEKYRTMINVLKKS